MRSFVTAVSASCALTLAAASFAQPVPDPEPVVEPEPEPVPQPAPEPAPEPEPPLPELPEGHPPIHPAPEAGKPPVTDLPPVPLAPPAIFPSQLEDETTIPLAGIHGDRLFIRDARDIIRLYPGGRLRTDFLWAPGAPELSAAQGGSELQPQFMVRRVRLELSGELFMRLAFTGGIELGGQRIGETELSDAGAPRFAMASAHDGEVLPGEVTVSYRFRDWLNFTAGLLNAPVTMSNRTREPVTTPMERPLAIRGLVVPNEQELGLTIWGELFGERTLAYEIGVFSGDGPTRPAVDAHPDFMGRIFARPLAPLGTGAFFDMAQIGVSGRYGSKDQDYVGYDYPTMATAHGFVLWQPGYTDSMNRVTHVIPSGDQATIGGELRLPFDLPGGRAIDVQAEAYFVGNNTREAIDQFQLTNTERFGRVKGVGWYAQLSAWVCGDAFVSGEPGVYRPVTVDLTKEAPILKGLELFALVGGIHANYNGATREGVDGGPSIPDARTPDTDITAYEFGGGLQFWYGQIFRAAINYMAYYTPDSQDPAANLAIVPDNLRIDGTERGARNDHHELGARLAVTF